MSFGIIANPATVAPVAVVEDHSEYQARYEAGRQKEISQAIYQQIGGGRFKLMTGAKLFIQTKNGLQITFPNRAAGMPNNVAITLDADDTYTVTFQRVRGMNVTTTSTHDGIYCDMLQSLFERKTGLYLTF